MKLLPYRIERPLQGLRFRMSRRLPDRHPAAVWPGIEAVSVRLCPFQGQLANIKQYDLMVLCAVVRHMRARTVFEFGTFDGLTTWHLAANGGPRVRVWTMDLPPDRLLGTRTGEVGVGDRFHGTRPGDRIEQIYCDSLAFDPEPFRGLIDFCLIDGGHDYVHVCRDTANALTMVRPGGVLFWNAYSRWWPGVQKCLDDLSRGLPVFALAGTALAALCVPEETASY